MIDKTKMTLLTLEYPPMRGGVGRYYAGLVTNWGNENIQVISQKLTWGLWPHWLPVFWQMRKIFKINPPAILGIGQVLPLGYVALWYKKRHNLPYVVFTHGMDILIPQTSKWKLFWLNKILQAADLVVANSEFTKQQLLNFQVPEDKIEIVFPGVSLTQSVSAEKLEELKNTYNIQDKKIILSVGRLVKRKGFYKVLDILPKIIKRVPEALYVVIGSGPEADNLHQMVEQKQVTNNVLFLNNINDEDLAAWYNLADVFVMPCEQIGADVEGLGIVFLEAAMAKKPIVVGNSGGAAETVKHGYSGFLIDPESSDELYQALLKLLTDTNFAQRLGNYGHDWVIKNFNWSREVAKLKNKLWP